ncbi:phosphate ABC transporter permease subunit PstC [Nibricoccus sp. IMCC34717]|uniref:phosphate ABC transporter permease subunit PstC n=1 Tax=Nibricoccus sp. IMCC34717 TaxID=3034021 RepID=UPI0038513DF6
MITEPPPQPTQPEPPIAIIKERTRFFGLTLDECVQAFFGGNALMAVVILALITIFLFKEGASFFAQNDSNLAVYRQAGLEFIDIPRASETAHTSLTRDLTSMRVKALRQMTEKGGLTLAQANEKLQAFDDYAGRFGDLVVPLRGLISDYSEVASAIKTKFTIAEDGKTERAQYLAAGKVREAEAVVIQTVNFTQELRPLLDAKPQFREALEVLGRETQALASEFPQIEGIDGEDVTKFQNDAQATVNAIPATVAQMETWDFQKPVAWYERFTAFIFGRQWLTASFWQDWYGVVPLLVGSLMVSSVALVLAVPLGVGAAIYVNQLANQQEQKFIKPAIEFISAIPSVVLGFFGIAVLGELLRTFSQAEWLSWFPGFPIIERLNVLTAGCLLALISVPTIFTLSEDALNNVPRAFKEASYALGANRLQTIIRIIVPAALSGIISAVLLGFGRVIGETMVVLLCAGNRIAIPDFTAGIGVVTQPVHTMTGIVAQEMGEVVRGSIHYRALFVIGIVLFFLSLLINFIAQKIVRRYRISIG